MMLHQRQVTLIKRRMKCQKILGDRKRHDGIAKEFEHLILRLSGRGFVAYVKILKYPRAMCYRTLKKLNIAKTVTDRPFEVAEIR